MQALIDPHSLWSLWVPLLLLNLIGIAALYFLNAKIR
jgi:hypothetical protein